MTEYFILSKFFSSDNPAYAAATNGKEVFCENADPGSNGQVSDTNLQGIHNLYQWFIYVLVFLVESHYD